MIGEEKVTMSITLKIEKSQVLNFEYWLKENLEVIKSQILPETEELYEKDAYFRNIVKKVKEAQRIRDKYINDHL